MSLSDPALITGLALVVGAVVGAGLVMTRRRQPEVLVTITRNALPPRGSPPAIDTSDPVAVRVGEAQPPVAVRIASGADPVLYRLLALDSPDDIAALELASPPGHEDGGAALQATRTGPVEWQQAGEIGRARVPLFARTTSGAPGNLATVGIGDAEPRAEGDGPAGEEPARVLAGVAVPDDGRAGDAAEGAGRAPSLPAPVAASSPAGPGADGSSERERQALDDGGGERPGSPAGSEACGAERHLVRELSALVTRARAVHEDALDRQRRLQREHDAASARAEAAAHVMDGRRVLEEKEAAQRRFRSDRTSAQDAAAVEEAAARWLSTINQLNVRVRDAQRVAAAERRRATRLVAEIEAGGGRVDAARIALESAEHKVHDAREALAACEELHGARLAAALIASTAGSPAERPGVTEAVPSAADASGGVGTARQVGQDGTTAGPPVGGGVEAAATPAAATAAVPAQDADDDTVVRGQVRPRSLLEAILEGDEDALAAAVVALAPDSIDDGRRWHLELSALRDALTWGAIEAALVDLPRDHAFWSEFSPEETREIAVALSSLGYRYDGRGGFADGRIPSTRDLALSVGYAGLDPRRIRRWPGPAEIPLLLQGARVALVEFVRAGAPDLSLGQMVTLLGRRAPQFTALWDEWGRLRPVLAGPLA